MAIQGSKGSQVSVVRHSENGYRVRNICVVGCGYVGLVTAAGFASLAKKVTGLERDHAGPMDGIDSLMAGNWA